MSLSIPFSFVGGPGNKAKASQVNANFQAIAAKFTEGAGGIADSDISSSAAIKGSKLSSLAGNRVPTDRIEDDAIDKDKLRDDTSAGSPTAAVNTSSHIKDGIITSAKLVDNTIASAKMLDAALLSGKLKIVTTINSSIINILANGSRLWDTGLLAAQNVPVCAYLNNAGDPAVEQYVVLKVYKSTTSDHLWVILFNASGSTVTFGNIILVTLSSV